MTPKMIIIIGKIVVGEWYLYLDTYMGGLWLGSILSFNEYTLEENNYRRLSQTLYLTGAQRCLILSTAGEYNKLSYNVYLKHDKGSNRFVITAVLILM